MDQGWSHAEIQIQGQGYTENTINQQMECVEKLHFSGLKEAD